MAGSGRSTCNEHVQRTLGRAGFAAIYLVMVWSAGGAQAWASLPALIVLLLTAIISIWSLQV